jgi:signal transduction histidine kinase
MFRSLRFRLPLFFLAGIAIALAIATALALRLFQDYARDQSIKELQREAVGVEQLYARVAGQKAIPYGPRVLEQTTGDRIYYTGLPIFFEASGLRKIPRGVVDVNSLPRGSNTVFEFTPPGEDRKFLAVARPVDLDQSRWGAIVVAKPRADIRERWLQLLQRLALAGAGGLLVAAGLAWYLSRRVAAPMQDLARAADEIARGRYEVDLPEVPEGGEIGHLADRFRQMAGRLAEADARERNFLMSVSHELRTPLTAIRGHVDALREGLVEDPELRSASLDVIAAESDRLARLVGDILDLAKLDAHRFTLLEEEVDMEALTERAYSSFSEEARRRAIVYRHDVTARPVIVTDGDRVLQIISNLLSNAFRWTPDGGLIELSLLQANGNVCVAVRDTGPGIEPDERERIFRPFVSHDGSGGTGLGLTIARELASALGGRIELETQPGRGSRFRLLLPGD